MASGSPRTWGAFGLVMEITILGASFVLPLLLIWKTRNRSLKKGRYDYITIFCGIPAILLLLYVSYWQMMYHYYSNSLLFLSAMALWGCSLALVARRWIPQISGDSHTDEDAYGPRPSLTEVRKPIEIKVLATSLKKVISLEVQLDHTVGSLIEIVCRDLRLGKSDAWQLVWHGT